MPKRPSRREAAPRGAEAGRGPARAAAGPGPAEAHEHLAHLNDEQAGAAAALDGPVQVNAGAGSGKTTLLVARCVHVWRTRWTRPRRFLTVTFLKAMATEFRERLAVHAGRNRADSFEVRTLHSLGNLLLRDAPDVAGLTREYEIVGDEQIRPLIRHLLSDGGRTRVLRDDIRSVEQIVAMLKERAVLPGDDPPPEVLHAVAGAGHADRIVDRAIALYPAYQDAMRREDWADFADLQLWPLVAMRDDDGLRRDWADWFDGIQVDEYQDTSREQDEILTLLAKDHANICVVGDDWQSLYGWRGAEVGNTLTFEERWAAMGHRVRRFDLWRNYRSTRTIVDAARAVIRVNVRQLDKRMEAAARGGRDADRGAPVEIVEAGSLAGLADWTAARIRAFAEERPDGTAFVLYRANFLSRPVEEALVAHDLSYTVAGDRSFYDRQEVRDALAYLALALDPADRDAWGRIANIPARGLGDAARKQILAEAGWPVGRDDEDGDDGAEARPRGGPGGDLLAAGLRLAAEGRLRRDAAAGARALAATVDAFRSDERELAPALQDYLAAAGYLRYWEASDDPAAPDRLDNLGELLNAAAESVDAQMLLERARRIREAADHADAPVRLLSMHRAKGSEADLAILFGMMEGFCPASAAIRAEEHGEADRMEEERRVAFVGMTRPRVQLCLGWTATPYAGKAMEPSRFLDEIPEELVVRLQAGEARRARRGRAA
jgi:DNA helicase-2/ATP-dependent DNA helicase PcrA